MVEINSTNFIWSLELPFLCVCRIFSINALNQYNPSLESRVGKNMFSLSLNSLSKQIVQNQSVITGSLSSILQPRSSPSSWWSNAGAPGVGARVVRRLSCAVPLSEEHPDRRDSHGVLSIINININITTNISFMSITIGSIILIEYTMTMIMPTVLRWPSSTSSHGRTAPSRPRLAPSSSSEGRKIRWSVLRLRLAVLPWRLKKVCVKSSVVDIVERSFATNW